MITTLLDLISTEGVIQKVKEDEAFENLRFSMCKNWKFLQHANTLCLLFTKLRLANIEIKDFDSPRKLRFQGRGNEISSGMQTLCVCERQNWKFWQFLKKISGVIILFTFIITRLNNDHIIINFYNKSGYGVWK